MFNVKKGQVKGVTPSSEFYYRSEMSSNKSQQNNYQSNII